MKVVDMHVDTISRLLDSERNNQNINLKDNDFDVDLNKLIKGDYLLQNFAMFVGLKDVINPEHECLALIDKYCREIDMYQDIIKPVFKYQDIIDNAKEGKISSLLTLEEGDVVFNDLAMLRNYYRLGVRMICLTWNYPNAIGSPNFTKDDKLSRYDMLRHINTKDGLSEFGIEYIKEMERLGIIIDVSHLSDKGFDDVYEYTTKPFVASHSNARSICNVARNLSDDMIKKIASRGGVIGINYCKDFLDDDGIGDIKTIVKHIKHIISVGGVECVGLGSDFDGIKKRETLSDASFMNELYLELKSQSFKEEDIEKIFYKNVLRVYKEILV